MKISVYGAGYVGLVSAACLAKLGHRVICVDVNEEKVRLLQKARCPIYEPQLPELLREQIQKEQLVFSSNIKQAVVNSELHIIATGTPSLANGSADISQVEAVVSSIVKWITANATVLVKSTVPPGTGDLLQEKIDEELVYYNKKIKITVVSNPEFLREGRAVYDFLNADRIIIGGEAPSLFLVQSMYKSLTDRGIPLLTMSRCSAELTKYAANAMLACRISFMNQISQLAEVFDADIGEVAQGMGLDPRIGPHFLQAGIGYGGSCFPKDVRALLHLIKANNINANLFEVIDEVNQEQKEWLFRKIKNHFNSLKGVCIGVWGLSFKPGTDDLREASSLVIIQKLLVEGVRLKLYDPLTIPEAKSLFPENEALTWCNSAVAALEKVDALVIVTEWPEFKNFDLNRLKQYLDKKPIFDGRNCFDLSGVIAAKLFYHSVGRPAISEAFYKEKKCS